MASSVFDIKSLLRFFACNPREQFWHRGVDLNRDIALTCPRSQIRTIFDVGAFVGDETSKFLRAWPDANIYSFEPSPKTFLVLAGRMRDPRVTPVNAAVSSEDGTGSFALLDATEAGSSNHLCDQQACSQTNDASHIISVEKTTIDRFCAKASIDRIDILKVDTEGHELEVLAGARRMLQAKGVSFLRLECGVDPKNARHVSLERAVAYLADYGYLVFGFYEQENEFFHKEPQLRRVDVAFVSPTEVERNRGFSNRSPATLLDCAVKVKRKVVGR